MASAQVLRKQNLEAGKKKLKEFRERKAAEKAKKATSAGGQASEGGLSEKQLSEYDHVRLTNSDAAGTSHSVRAPFSESSAIATNNDINEIETSKKSSYSSSQNASSSPDSAKNVDVGPEVPIESRMQNKEFRGDNTSHITEQLNGHYNLPGENEIRRPESGLLTDHSIVQPPFWSAESTSSQSGYHGFHETLPQVSDNIFKDLSNVNFTQSSVYENGFPEYSGNSFLHDKPGSGNHVVTSLASSSYEVGFLHSTRSNTNYNTEVGQRMSAKESNDSVIPDPGEDKYAGSHHITNTSASTPWSTGSPYATFSSSTYEQAGSNIRRSRLSFLDSINISKVPLQTSLSEPEKVEPSSSKVFPEDTLGSSDLKNSENPIFAPGKGIDLFKQDNKQNEDFTALEQHIEDLTQEKFSLQRTLEASRTLAESLAAENSALTDSYNQQGSLVNQLKFDMEKLQEEIKFKLVELESVRIEYANAQMECDAADERAKLLASEVIGLEEKALRLRSNELKLERQLEEAQAEISSFKKKISSLERERQDLHSTIDALQEEKKLLQSKLRKATVGIKSPDVTKSLSNKKDVSTSTEDLGETSDADKMEISNMEGYHQLSHENGQFSLQGLSWAIPPDQIRMIENINTLIAELTLEKEGLARALSAESSQSSKLKELNKDLTRKLEVQTQRLELLTSQSMVSESSQARHADARIIDENTPRYADEGDEVVERVLSWIMKLFPGGPSRRRTSKLL